MTKRYSWLVVFLESFGYWLVIAPVMSLAQYLPTHDFSSAGWDFWPLGDWFKGEFDPILIAAFLGLTWLTAAIRRSQRKELFDE